ncbi:MAG TPA: exodeoxyribonuclease III [Candidatus Limnocylindrales bacterium]
MRIATWNVNSLNARMERVEGWLRAAQPDILLMQETKLADDAVPEMAFGMLGYELVHHGEGRWNGVAIASRVGASDVVTNFGDGPVRSSALPAAGAGGSAAGAGGSAAGADGSAAGAGGSAAGAAAAFQEEDFDPFDEARMVSAVCGGIRVVSIYAPNGRIVGSPFYAGKLAWFERLGRWLGEAADPALPLVIGGDFNVAPTDEDVWDAAAVHGGTHVSPAEREAFGRLLAWGLTDTYRLLNPGAVARFTWWDYRAGNFQRNEGMRIDHLLATAPVAARVVGADIDREARKGKPTPSDHAPLFIDLDEPGAPIDTGWSDGADERFAARRAIETARRAARARHA